MRDTDGSAPVVARAREAGMRVRAYLGIDTGVDLAKLVETSSWLAQRMGRPSSRTVRAMTAGRSRTLLWLLTAGRPRTTPQQ